MIKNDEATNSGIWERERDRDKNEQISFFLRRKKHRYGDRVDQSKIRRRKNILITR